MREAYNITYTGVIVDEETLLPITGSKVISQCLYQSNIDESDFDNAIISTDSLGIFKLQFDKGYKIDVQILADGYFNNNMELFPSKKQLPDTIYLMKKLEFETRLTNPVILSE